MKKRELPKPWANASRDTKLEPAAVQELLEYVDARPELAKAIDDADALAAARGKRRRARR